jgi:glycosyltransferase involved in cell wall biosynthesis
MHNAGRWVADALESILGQTYSNLDVLVLDDASTDDSAEIVSGFRDPRLRRHRNERNLGQFESVNAGIRLARGDLIAVHHADDVYEPELIAEEVAYLVAEPAAGAVFAIDTFIDPHGVPYGRLELPPEFRGRRPLGHSEVLNGVLRYGNTMLRASSSLVRREVYEKVGLFDDRYDLRADLEMWLRISRSSPIAIIDRHLVRYRWGHDNVSQSYERLRTEPELTFALLDELLLDGDIAVAQPDALSAFEGRRAEDLLIVAANLYTVNRKGDGRAMLHRVQPRRLLATSQVRRGRLLVLWVALHVLLRLPRVDFVARVFHRRWGLGRGR